MNKRNVIPPRPTRWARQDPVKFSTSSLRKQGSREYPEIPAFAGMTHKRDVIPGKRDIILEKKTSSRVKETSS